MKISAFASMALLCIDVGEYDKLGKTVSLGHGCGKGFARDTKKERKMVLVWLKKILDRFLIISLVLRQNLTN